jgi:hypothetical protein
VWCCDLGSEKEGIFGYHDNRFFLVVFPLERDQQLKNGSRRRIEEKSTTGKEGGLKLNIGLRMP